MKLPFEMALLLSPHVDDVEVSMGGTLARLLEEGCDCFLVAFSTGNPADGSNMGEFRASMEVLGVDNFVAHDYNTRHFGADRQSILDNLFVYKKRLRPDVVFVPSTDQVHQDHEVVTAEAIRAFRDCTILGYESVWNQVDRPFRPGLFVSLSREHIRARLDAVKCYQSQLLARTSTTNSYHLLERARMRAVQAGIGQGESLAEAFEVIRWIMWRG